MSPHAVAEIDSPREVARDAVRVIVEAREEAPNPADRDAEDQRRDVKVAGAPRNPEQLLRDFHAEPSADQAADDRLPAQPHTRVAARGPILRPRLDPRE